MKKHVLRALALLLVLTLVVPVFSACARHGKTAIRVGDHEISVNVYMLYLSRMKGSLSAAGESVNDPDYWKTYISTDGTTYNEYYTGKVLEGMKQIAAALYLYDELGLELSSDMEDSIDAWIDTLVEEVADGSKSQMNSILSAYGANLTVLRDAALLEARIEQLKTHLYGESGALLGATAKEEFYQATYYRGFQMLYANYYPDHEKDAEGNSVYYQKDSAKIAYDTENGVATEEKDKNGDTVYRKQKDDGSLGAIAYDSEKGTLKYFKDEDGEQTYSFYSDEEMELRYDILSEIAEKCKNNPALYLDYAAKLSDNTEFNSTYAPNGMYFSAGAYVSDQVFGTFATELAKLEIGELAILESEIGYYLIMRVDLDTEAWAHDANARWFSTMNTLCVEYMLQQRTADYLQYVNVDESLLEGIDMASIAANNYY